MNAVKQLSIIWILVFDITFRCVNFGKTLRKTSFELVFAKSETFGLKFSQYLLSQLEVLDYCWEKNRESIFPWAYSQTWCIERPGVFRAPAYSEPWHIQNPGVYRTVAYSEPWHIQNLGIFRTLAYSEPWYIQNPGVFRILAYSELYHIQNPGIFRTLV